LEEIERKKAQERREERLIQFEVDRCTQTMSQLYGPAQRSMARPY